MLFAFSFMHEKAFSPKYSHIQVFNFFLSQLLAPIVFPEKSPKSWTIQMPSEEVWVSFFEHFLLLTNPMPKGTLRHKSRKKCLSSLLPQKNNLISPINNSSIYTDGWAKWVVCMIRWGKRLLTSCFDTRGSELVCYVEKAWLRTLVWCII